MKKIWQWLNKYEELIVFISGVILLRLPTLFSPHYYGDEEIYFVVGRMWKAGYQLYTQAFDHKPPFIYILAGLMNNSMVRWRMFFLVWMIMYTIVFWQMARWFWGKKKWLRRISVLIFVLLSNLPLWEGNIGNGELLMMLPGLISIYWLLRIEERNRWKWGEMFLTGLVGGIGLMFKVPVGIDFAFVWIWIMFFRGRFSSKMIASWLGFITPYLVGLGYFSLKGVREAYLKATLLINLGYTSSYKTSSYHFNPLASGLFMRGLALVGLVVLLWLVRKKVNQRLALASLWFGFAFFGALLSARPYPHYLQEIVPSVALLGGVIFEIEKVIEWLIIALLISSGWWAQKTIKFWEYPVGSYYSNFWQLVTKQKNINQYLSFFGDYERMAKVARFLRERMTAQDKLYVWGNNPSLYNLTNTLPTGGKYVVSFHVRDFQAWQEVKKNLLNQQPEWIVIIEPIGQFSWLSNYLEKNYILIQEIEKVKIYKKFQVWQQ